ncbi:hypothetical protein [Campylobacter geochelonis]|nr:hypothetical protein [Campylobacter geochelonis]CZE48195.1 Uncharacterised protein [Campylobacter geochelonis]CZE48200.1 Uncharacterised protein [Campylobacter geochelonis]
MPIKVEGFDEVIKKLQNLQALEVKTKPLMSQIDILSLTLLRIAIRRG